MSVAIGTPQPRRARAAGVERGEDERRHDHPAERRDAGQRGPARLAELAVDHLALDLEADDEEEEGHQPVVDPRTDRERPQVRAPGLGVRRRIDVRPRQCRHRGGDEREAGIRLDGHELRPEWGQETADAGGAQVAWGLAHELLRAVGDDVADQTSRHAKSASVPAASGLCRG